MVFAPAKIEKPPSPQKRKEGVAGPDVVNSSEQFLITLLRSPRQTNLSGEKKASGAFVLPLPGNTKAANHCVKVCRRSSAKITLLPTSAEVIM
jgi:hypothetical protein